MTDSISQQALSWEVFWLQPSDPAHLPHAHHQKWDLCRQGAQSGGWDGAAVRIKTGGRGLGDPKISCGCDSRCGGGGAMGLGQSHDPLLLTPQ